MNDPIFTPEVALAVDRELSRCVSELLQAAGAMNSMRCALAQGAVLRYTFAGGAAGSHFANLAKSLTRLRDLYGSDAAIAIPGGIVH